jgi:hypothetical protein
MAIPKRNVNIRLTPELADALDRLAGEIPALPKSTLLRALLSEQFARPLHDQVASVTKALMRKSGNSMRHSPGLNARSRVLGE